MNVEMNTTTEEGKR